MNNTLTVQHFIADELASRPHEFVYWLDFIQRFETDTALEGAFIGSYSLTAPRLNKTFVATHHVWCERPASAASVARRILSHGLRLLKRKRIPWNRQAVPLLAIPHPLYCQPTITPHPMWYVDVSAAYYSIYSVMPFDFWFDGNYSLGGDLQFADFLPQDLDKYKLCRNSIVGVLRTTQSSRLRKGVVVGDRARNSLLSPYHWGFIAHLLHSLAHMAVKNNAIYYNTDGAIFLSEADAINWARQVSDYGFKTNIKQQGYGICWGIGRYKIGDDAVGAQHTACVATNNLITPSDKCLTDYGKML